MLRNSSNGTLGAISTTWAPAARTASRMASRMPSASNVERPPTMATSETGPDSVCSLRSRISSAPPTTSARRCRSPVLNPNWIVRSSANLATQTYIVISAAEYRYAVLFGRSGATCPNSRA